MFYISGVITSATLRRLIKYLHTEATENDFYVYINSPGGCTRSALAMYEILRSFAEKYNVKVITQVMDECYSAGLILYLAGDIRCATKFSTFMIHEVSVEEARHKSAKGYKQTAVELEKETSILYSIIKERSKLKIGTIRNKVLKAPDNDWIFEVGEAQRWGIVTHPCFYLPDMLPDPNDIEAEIEVEEEGEEESAEDESSAAESEQDEDLAEAS